MLTDFLPTTRKEMDLRKWNEADIILFSADAYVDHPSFGAAVIGRTLEAEGYRVAIVPQPDWHGDFRDFRKLGRPKLFFAIAPGCMDSMVNKYTANRRLRSEDAYSPDGRHDLRPEYPTIVYTKILKQLFPDVPVVLGGIEASLRRVTHFDYWQEKLRPSILCESGADLLIYGMGELPILELSNLMATEVLKTETPMNAALFKEILRRTPVPQTVTLERKNDIKGGICDTDILLHAHEDCLKSKAQFAENFRLVEIESNRLQARRILQPVGNKFVVVNPPFPPMTTEQIDHSYDLPYTRLPHPKYKGKRIPAYDMIKFSVNIHRGCFGGCSFCTISAHQGKFIMSRSKESILREVKKICEMPDFKGNLSDLGGPSANMYRMEGRDKSLCAKCSRPSCLHPTLCKNMQADHRPLIELYKAVDALPGIKRSYVGSGVRYDLILANHTEPAAQKAAKDYAEELITRHVSGRLKVAPEHTASHVLRLMRKPEFSLFRQFKTLFDDICKKHGLRQQLIPYFISSHPGCSDEDMAELAVETKKMNFRLEQVQDFTPTPMTLSTDTWYSGFDPYTMKEIRSAKTPQEKTRQKMFFFWYKPEERSRIMQALKKMKRNDLIKRLFVFLAALSLTATSSLQAQNAWENATKAIDYEAEAQVTAGDGDTPLWMTANKHGLSSVVHDNGYLRLAAFHKAETDSARKWRIGWGLDLVAGYGMASPVTVQQFYADFDYKLVRLTVGAKEHPMAFKNQELSSGSQTFGINSRPIPDIRFSLPNYWSITGPSAWVSIKGHVGYGYITDAGFQKDYVAPDGKRSEHVLYHSKAGYMRIGNPKKFPLTFEGGLEMASFFGGRIYNAGSYFGEIPVLDMKHGFRQFFDVLLGIGSDPTDSGYDNASGNTVGSWLFRLNYEAKDWSAAVYYDHFFEDHSQMFFEYGWLDGLLGVEVNLPKNPVVSSIVYEHVKTDYQSGPVYHDHTEAIPDQISGIDNYYNHNIYAGWQHWGQAIGNPLFVSPLYFHRASLAFPGNRFKAHHLGFSGDPTKEWHYRVLYSHQRNWGTYATPFSRPRQLHSFLAEVTWTPEKIGKWNTKGWSAKLGYALDRGNLIRHNTGFQLTLSKTGRFL